MFVQHSFRVQLHTVQLPCTTTYSTASVYSLRVQLQYSLRVQLQYSLRVQLQYSLRVQLQYSLRGQLQYSLRVQPDTVQPPCAITYSTASVCN